jgi:hypothetical protein
MPKGPWRKQIQTNEIEKEYALKLKHTGKGLHKVTMLITQGNQIIEEKDISSPDLKKIALHRLRQAAYQLYFMQQEPQSQLSPLQPTNVFI